MGLKCVRMSRIDSFLNLSPLYTFMSKNVVSVSEISAVNLGSKSSLCHWLAVSANRNQGILIRHKGTNHKKFMPSRRMSNILTYVRVALATSDVQSIRNTGN